MAPNALFGSSTGTAFDGKLPPEERFWKRYSANHECPLSGVTSFALHALILAALLGGAWVLARLGLMSKDKPPPVDAVVIVGGGGSGPRIAGGRGPGNGEQAPAPEEAAAQPGDEPKKPAPEKVERPELAKENLKPAPLDLPDLSNDLQFKRLVERGAAAAVAVDSLEKDTRGKLLHGLASNQRPGGDGTPAGGGPGTGGNGPGPGNGQGKLTQRQKRVLRWTMIFNTRDGADYARQLYALGAILAVPDGQGQYMVYRDLSRAPGRGQVEDLAEIKRIFWVDDRPDSVHALSMHFRFNPPPDRVVAFFPEELEKKLLKLELEYGGKPEDDIEETKFEVRRAGSTYEPHVVSQR